MKHTQHPLKTAARLLTLAATLIFGALGASAQTPVTKTIGTGTSGNAMAPFLNNQVTGWTQTIYKADDVDLPTGATINTIAFNCTSVQSGFTAPTISIYMGHSTSPVSASNTDWVPMSDLTLVYSGLEAQPMSTGWGDIDLTTPFDYNGTDHLVICILRSGTANASNQRYAYTTSTAGSFQYKASVSGHPGSERGTRTALVANLRIKALANAGCFNPQAVAASNVTRTTADLTITAPAIGTPVGYYVEYMVSGDPSTKASTTFSSTRGTLTGLRPSSKYDIRVRSICGAADTSSSDAATTLITECAPYDLPYSEDFSSCQGYSSYNPANELPLCWDFPAISTTTTGYPRIFVNAYNNLRLASRNGVAAYAVLPAINCQPDHSVLVFNASVGINMEAHYGYMANPADVSTFVPIGRIQSTGEHRIDFEETAESVPYGARFAFRAISTASTESALSLSSVGVVAGEICKRPIDFYVDSTNLTATSVRLYWSGDQRPGETYRLRYVRYNATSDTVLVAEGITAQDYTVSGLMTGLQYYFFVDKLCGGSYTDFAQRNLTLPGYVSISSEDSERGYVVGLVQGMPGSTTPFRAVANPHYSFVQWSDGITTNPRNFPYGNAGNVTPYMAQFVPDSHAISVNAINPLFGSVSDHTGRHAYGSVLPLTATPNAGYKFIGWSDGTATPSYNYTVRRDASLVAYFCPEDQTMILGTLNDPLLGTITTSPAGGVVTGGQTVTITATVNDPDHYTFRWNPEVGTASVSGNTYTLTLTAGTQSMIVAGIIEPARFTIQVTDLDTTLGNVIGVGEYEYGDDVTLVAQSTRYSKFVQWRGDAYTNANPLTVNVNGNKTLRAVFVRDSVTIQVEPSYVDRGTVAIVGAAPGVNSIRVAVGDSITITTTALEHYSFHSWSNGIYTATQTIVASGANGTSRTYTAYFQPDMHTISGLSADATMGSVDGSASYGYGTVAYLEAIPAHGYMFVRWDNGTTDNPYRPAVTGDKSYTAYFAPMPLTITAAPDDAAHGSASVSGNLIYRGIVTLTADTLPGWSFANWTNAEGTVVSTDRIHTFQATADSAFTANYTQTLYHVTVTATPGMGVLTPAIDGDYHYGDVITTIASPVDPTRYEFAYWSIDGSTFPTLNWTVTSSANIVAHFNQKGGFVVSLSANHPGWGTVYSDKPSYNMDEMAVLTADPAEHYEFVGWNDGNTRNHRVMVMRGDSTLQALFAPKTYTVTALPADPTKGYVDGSGRFPYDTTVTLTATPLAGQYVSGWNGASGTLPTVSIRVSSDTNITALFATSDMPVSVTGNNATTTGSGSYPYGSTVTISATPDANYSFVRWNDGNVINPRTIVVDSTANYVAFTAPLEYTISVVANDPNMGYVSGGGTRPFGSSAVRIEAVAYENCHFVRWDDGETAANRLVAYDGNRTYTAIFARDSFEVRLLAADAALGSVNTEVNGTYIYDSRVVLRATANAGVAFTEWSDGVADNPRVLAVTANYLDLAARFDSLAYSLDTATNDNLMGHIVLSPAKASYRHGELVTVSYVNHDDNLYRFVGWEDASTAASRILKVEGDLFVRAIFTEADKYSVSALTNSPALGTTLGSATNVPNGSTHTLTARAAAHCHFLAWSDGVTDSVRTVTVSGSDVLLVATFAADTHTVAFSAVSNGTLAGAGRYVYGSTATLYATPADHYHFVAWSDGVTANPRQYVANADTTLGATFEVDSVTIKVVAPNAATVIGAGTYAYNSRVSLRVTPSVNYHFVNWTLNGVPVSTNVNLPAFFATENATYVANFAIDSVNLTVNVNDREFGYVNGAVMGQTVKMPYGSTVNLEAVALSHRTFGQWSNGESNASYSLTLTADTTLTAIFTVDSFTVNIVSADLSMGSVNNAAVASRKYAYGELVTLEATPEYGFEFLYWTPGNIAANPLNQQVVSNHIYTAHFVARQLNVYAQSADETMGTVTVSPSRNTYTYNETITVTATPAAHHHFVQWSDGSTDAERTFAVTQDTLLTATFAIDTFELTLAANDYAMGTVFGAGVYDWNSTVTIYTTANEGYHFVAWDDNVTDNPRQVVLTTDTLFTALFAADTHYATVAVVSVNTEWGTVSASASEVIIGSNVTITATPAAHYHFVQWSDGSTDAERTFAVTQDTLLTATFAIDTFELTLAANDYAMGTVFGAGVYDWNSTVTIYTTANEGYHFVAWDDDVTDNPRQVVLTTDTLFTALFAADSVPVVIPDSVMINAYAVNGTVTGAGLYEVGEEVTLVATANSGYIFSTWVKNGAAIDGTETLVFTADSAASFVAIFIADTTTVVTPDSVMINAYAINGTVTGAGLYEVGEMVTLEAMPYDTTYRFTGWVKNGQPVDGEQTLVFAADSNAMYVALFESVVMPVVVDSFTLTVLSADETMGTVSGSGRYEYRDLVSVSATPATGYRFTGWSDGVQEASRLVYITRDSILTASFEIIRCTVSLAGNHTLLQGAGTYDYGTEVTVSATPDYGYEFVRWIDATGATVSTEASYTFTITSDVDLTAAVRGVTLNVTGEASPAAAGFINGLGTYRYGDTVTVTAQANEGFRFVEWTLPSGSHVSTAYYTFVITENTHVVANFVEVVGINDADAAEVKVYTEGSRLHVLGAEGRQVRVFDAVGRQVVSRQAQSSDIEIDLPAAGVYMVQVGQMSAKRVVVMR